MLVTEFAIGEGPLIRTTPGLRTEQLTASAVWRLAEPEDPEKGIVIIEEASPITDARAADRVGFAVWNQLAIEGEYKGHPTGDFYLGRAEMEQIVHNFRAHPCYEPDPGKRRPIVTGEDQGHGQVIPFDYHHASEGPASDVAVSGAPAQSWIHDMAMRLGPKSGKLELWGLVEFLEPARTYVKEGKYRFTSIAFWPNAKDPHTGADIGCYVSSVAFTNDPFIQGMEALVASRQPAELVNNLKKLLQLPETATEGDVLAAVELGRAATDPASATGVAPTQRIPEKLMPNLLTRIASKLGVEVADDATEAQQAAAAERIVAAIVALKTERDGSAAAQQQAEAIVAGIAKALGVQPSGVAEGVVALQTARDKAMEALTALATVLGVEDAAAATAKVGELMSASALLTEVMPALAALQEPAVAQEEQVEEQEVMEAMRYHVHPQSHQAMKPALLQMRRGGVVLPKLDPAKGVTQFAADCKALVAGIATKKAARAQFLQMYPLPQPTQQHLLQSFATTPTQPGASPVAYQQPHGQPPQPQPMMPDGPPAAGRIDLSRYPGRNDTERMMAYVRALAKQNNEPDLDFNTAWRRAACLMSGQPMCA